MTRPKIGATHGHHPERETWSEAHDRLMRDEHMARVAGARKPHLDGSPRRSLRPVLRALGAFVAILLVGWAVATWGVGIALTGIVFAAIAAFCFGAVLTKAWEEEESASDERPSLPESFFTDINKSVDNRENRR